MNRRRTSIAALLLILACSNLDNINIDTEGRATIPGRTVLDQLIGELSFLGFDSFDISQSQAFRNQGYTKDQIDSVRLARFTLVISAPEDGNFDFLADIHFFAEAEGLPRVEIARLDPVPAGSNELELDILDVDLRDYAVADTMTIVTEASGVRPEQETTVDARVAFDVDVAVSGGCQLSAR